MSSISKIQQILNERNSTHGYWKNQAEAACTIRGAIACCTSSALNPYQSEAINMIIVKISRIISGDPNIQDHWEDIAGYATLVAKELESEQSRGEGKTQEEVEAEECYRSVFGESLF